MEAEKGDRKRNEEVDEKRERKKKDKERGIYFKEINEIGIRKKKIERDKRIQNIDEI